MIPPSDLGVAIVGAGYWGPNLIRNFDKIEDCHVSWVCDKQPGRLQFIRERYPHLTITDDFENVLRDPKTDAVVIATPVATHHKLAMAALRAGKHVMVEKPFADTFARAQDMTQAAEDAQRVLAVGHLFVYHPAIARTRELIQSGKIGRLCYLESSRVNLGPPASEVNVIWDLAVHDVAILLYLWDQIPVQVTAYGGRYLHGALVDVAFLMLCFADGSMAQHHISWLSPEKVRRVFVAGTTGSFKFDDTLTEGKLRHIDQGEDSRIDLGIHESKELYYRPGQTSDLDFPMLEPLRVECEHFLNCIREGTRPRADGHAGQAVVRILEAANESLECGSVPIMIQAPSGLGGGRFVHESPNTRNPRGL